MRTTAVQSMTGIVPMKARAVTGTSSASVAVTAKMTGFLRSCRITFLSVLRIWRCHTLRVVYAEPVDDFERGEFGMLLHKLLAEFGLKRIAGAGPIIKRRSRKLDHRARFRLVADEHVALREMSRHVAQLFDRLHSRLRKMQYVAQPRELSQLRADELGLRVLQDCQPNRMRRLGCAHEVFDSLAGGNNCAVPLPGGAESVEDLRSQHRISQHRPDFIEHRDRRTEIPP